MQKEEDTEEFDATTVELRKTAVAEFAQKGGNDASLLPPTTAGATRGAAAAATAGTTKASSAPSTPRAQEARYVPAVNFVGSCYCWSLSCACSWTSSWIQGRLRRLRFSATLALNDICFFLLELHGHARAPAPVPAPEPDARIGRRALGPMNRSR